MTTTQKLNAAVQGHALTIKLERLQASMNALAVEMGEARQATQAMLEAFQFEKVEAARATEGWRGPLTGITKDQPVPGVTNPGLPYGVTAQWETTANPGRTQVTSPVPAAKAAGKVNLTDKARQLINTGHSYQGAINKLVADHPDRDREHIRRAVGRANGGKK